MKIGLLVVLSSYMIAISEKTEIPLKFHTKSVAMEVQGIHLKLSKRSTQNWTSVIGAG